MPDVTDLYLCITYGESVFKWITFFWMQQTLLQTVNLLNGDFSSATI